MISSDADLRLPLRSLRSRVLSGPVVQGRSARQVPQLREEAAAAPFHAGDRLQRFGLVQDGQPPRREELGLGQLRLREEGRRGILTAARAFARDVRVVATSFAEDECPFFAGAVAFQLFFATIPLLALVVGILGFAYGSERAQEELGQLLRDIYPSATAQETRIVRQLVEGRGVSLSVGVIGTILATGAIHGSIDKAMAAVLGVGRKRGFVRGHLDAFAFAGALVVLGVISLVISLVANPLSPLLGFAVGYVPFYLVYQYIPRVRVRSGTARMAALVSAMLWELAKIAFGFVAR